MLQEENIKSSCVIVIKLYVTVKTVTHCRYRFSWMLLENRKRGLQKPKGSPGTPSVSDKEGNIKKLLLKWQNHVESQHALTANETTF